MAKKILTFEEYVREADRSEEIEKEILDQGEVTNLEDEVEGSPEEVEVSEEDEEEVEDSVEDSEEEEEEVEDSEEEEVEETKNAAQLLKELYEGTCKSEAIAYEQDDYTEHTVETYLKEMAGLNASMMAETYEAACKEVKESAPSREAYEATCEMLKESYAKKLDELKETYEINDTDHDNPEGYPSPAGDSDDVA